VFYVETFVAIVIRSNSTWISFPLDWPATFDDFWIYFYLYIFVVLQYVVLFFIFNFWKLKWHLKQQYSLFEQIEYFAKSKVQFMANEACGQLRPNENNKYKNMRIVEWNTERVAINKRMNFKNFSSMSLSLSLSLVIAFSIWFLYLLLYYYYYYYLFIFVMLIL
jgi:hypothetical protein